MRIQIYQNTPPSSTNAPGTEDLIDTSDPSLFSQTPEWLLGSVVGAVVTVILTAIFSFKFWKPIWRRISRQSPVYVHIETDPRVIFANLDYDWITFPQFIPKSHDDLPPPPSGFAIEMGSWAANLGGFPALHCNYDVTITARENSHVVVNAFRVKAKKQYLPPGSVVIKGVGGASMEFRRIQVDLHTTQPRATYVEMGGAPASPFDFQLAPGESAKFNLIINAASDEDVDMYEWWGCLDLLTNGKRRKVRVGRGIWARLFDHGPEFKLVNRGRRPEFIHVPGSETTWEPIPSLD